MDPMTMQALMQMGQSVKQQTGGIAQAAIGFFGGRKAKKALGNLQAPTYTPAKGITDYYNEAQRRYQESPYQSNLYKMQAQNIQRGTQQGISALQDRRGALAGISGLIQGQNDAMLKAGVAAEQQKEQRFGQFANASGAMAGEQRQAWNINQMLPYQRKHDMLSQKASGYAQLLNAGLQNMWGGGQSGAMGMSGLAANSGGGTYSGGSQPYQETERNLPPSTYQVPLASY